MSNPIPAPEDGSLRIDTSMFVIFTSFGGTYPPNNRVDIRGFNFEDLEQRVYTAENGLLCFQMYIQITVYIYIYIYILMRNNSELLDCLPQHMLNCLIH